MKVVPLLVLLVIATAGIASGQSIPSHHGSKHTQKHDANADTSSAIAPYQPMALAPMPAIQAIPTIFFVDEKTGSEYGAADQYSPKHKDEGPKWTDIVVAIFTVVLGLAAIVSGVIAYFQWKALIAQDGRLKESIDKAEIASAQQSIDTNRAIAEAARASAAAERAADAADLSAKAAVRIELPILNIEKVEIIDFTQVDPLEWVKWIFPKVTIKNYGRSPAFIIKTIVNVHMGSIRPTKPVYTELRRHHERYVIEAEKDHTFDETYYYNTDVFANGPILPIDDENLWLYIYGVIHFLDYMDDPHERGFIWVWVPQNRSFVAIHVPEYHYQK